MPISFPVTIQTQVISAGRDKKVYYPQVTQMKNQRLEHFINQSIVQQTQKMINLQTGDAPSTVVEMLGYYEVKNNQRDVLSLSQSNYVYYYQAAHGMTIIQSLSFDLKTGKRCTLKDMFKPGSNYVKRLSDLIAVQIKQRDITLIDEYKGIKPDQDFYIADKALVIYFQLYDLTPYAFGFPMFPISEYDIQDIIDEDGPLSRMAENN